MEYFTLVKKYDQGKQTIFIALGFITLLALVLNSITYFNIHPIQEIILEICGITICSATLIMYFTKWRNKYEILYAVLTYSIIVSVFITHVYFVNFTDMSKLAKPQMLLRNISFIFIYMAFIGFISGRRHIYVIAFIVLCMISFYTFYVRDPFYRNNIHIFFLSISGYSAALHFFVKTTNGFIHNLEKATEESNLLKQIAEKRSNDLEDVNKELEKRQKEINQQKEKIQVQYESLEHTNRLLQASQQQILDQNKELDQHRNRLEYLVDLRTKELERALAKAEESDKLKTSFLANMSHEIRTPMNAILGFTSLLKNECPCEQRDEYISVIESNGLMLISLINDILDLSSIQSQHVSLNPKSHKLVTILGNLNEVFSREVIKKNLHLILNTKLINDDFEVFIDEFRLTQVFSNLLSNSYKFTDAGSIEFGVSKMDEKITFYVKDTGIGISKNVGDDIFKQFYKIEDSHKEVYRGTGLGLSICNSLVNLWQGEIWYESELGKGTTFYFTYPVLQSIDRTIIKVETSVNQTRDLKGKHILIAEDENSNYKLLEIYIKNTNADIYWAKNGLEAYETVKNNSVDLVLMDIKMPVMDGIEASKLIKEIKPNLPIIAQTAFAFKQEIEVILNSGINAYITKPINKDELINLIDKYL